MVDDAAAWQRAIDELLQREGLAIRSAIVLDQTDSTQDEARRRGIAPGTLIIASRQTAGRGRLGRRWIDERGEGVAMTLALASPPPHEAPRLAIAAAVAASLAIESVLEQPVGIKWPNDIVVASREASRERGTDGSRDQGIGGSGDRPFASTSLRKLAGVLIEQEDRAAMIGIGINVLQTQWPSDIRHRAISLRQLGCTASRLQVILAVMRSLDQALAMRDDELIEHFHRRDVLCGRMATLQIDRETVAGRVMRIGPLRGLAVLTDAGERWLPAATTTVVEW